ncbi:MAG: NAD(P)H-dependent oxidoreductase [bacterium]|nr:NAD(P)H-dependent oxidoreductase [bacterium]
MTGDTKFNIVLIPGSVREARQGIKVACWIAGLVEARGHRVDFIDPKEKPLPFLDKMYKEYDGDASPLLDDLHHRLERADGYVFVTPEYNHGVAPALKNLIDHFQSEFFFKPAAIAGYSKGGFGGVRAIEQMRLICIELGMTPTPIPFAVSKVIDTFEKPGQPIEKEKERLVERAERWIGEFEWYLEALKNQREKRRPY